jgi:Zn-dependent protease with chaperone function
MLLFTPGLEASLVAEHCHTNCQAHAPLVESPWLAGIGLAVLAAVLLLLAARFRFHVSVGHRLAGQLKAMGRPGKHYWLIDDENPLVFTLGWWKNHIFLTSGLLNRCSETDVTIILAHEREHVRRLDNARLLLARLFLLVLPPGLGKKLYADLHVFTESACDLAAAGGSDNLAVATTLLKVQRLAPSQFDYYGATVSSAFTGAEIERRIRILLSPAARSAPHSSVLCALGLLVCSVLLVDPLHHGVELFFHLADFPVIGARTGGTG